MSNDVDSQKPSKTIEDEAIRASIASMQIEGLNLSEEEIEVIRAKMTEGRKNAPEE